MARTTAPLLSFDAAGQIGKTQVYASWKGRAYARRYVIPSNPKSTEQTLTRTTFSWLQHAFAYFPTAAVAAWELKASNNRITANNQWIKDNLALLREETDLNQLVMSPAAGGGVPAGAFTVTPGNDQLQLVLAAPSLPTGWSIVKAHFAVIEDQDPQTETFYTVSYAERIFEWMRTEIVKRPPPVLPAADSASPPGRAPNDQPVWRRCADDDGRWRGPATPPTAH